MPCRLPEPPWPGCPGPRTLVCVISGAKQLLASEASRELRARGSNILDAARRQALGSELKASSRMGSCGGRVRRKAGAGLQGLKRGDRGWSQRPSSAPPSPRGSVTPLTHLAKTRQGAACACAGHCSVWEKTEVGKQCLTSQNVPGHWESATKTAQGPGVPRWSSDQDVPF